MCGIWGTIVTGKSGLFLAPKNFVYDSMIAGAVRGEHGTGIMFSPAKDPSLCAYMKHKGNPYWLLFHKDFGKFSKVMEDTAKFVVGHNRWATRGEHTDENAHPFQHEHITLVHNGTISSGVKYQDGVDVDSHALTIGLAEEGIDIFSKINGAFACIWHDAKTKKLNIARNAERPLHMVKSNGDFFFASEEDMLKWIVKRSHKNYSNLTVTDIPIEVNKLYSFDLENLGEPEVTPLPEKKHYYSQHTTRWEKTERNTGKDSSECGDFSCRETTTAKGKTQTKKSDDTLVKFRIVRKILHRVGHMELWLYFGHSLDNEAIWFQSKDEYPVGNTLYEAEIAEYKIDAWPYYGNNVLWYKVRTKTILMVDPVKEDEKELEEELAEEQQLRVVNAKRKCISCGTAIEANDYHSSTLVETSEKEYGFVCPECTHETFLPHMRKIPIQ